MLLVFRFPLVLTRNMLLSVFLWTWCIFVLPLAAFRIPFYHQFKAIFWLHGLVYCSSWFLVLRLCWTSWVFVFTVFIKFGKVSTIISFRYCPAISLWLQLHIYLGYLRLFHTSVQFSSFRFSRSVVSDSLRPHELQHARPPCPSPTPGVYSNSCPSSRWCHPAISSSVVPFSSCPQSFPASWSFPMSQLFAWGGQSTGVSALASVLPINSQDWSLLGWTSWTSLQSKGLSRVFSNTTVQKHQFFGTQPSS